jgi:hypothetical protein
LISRLDFAWITTFHILFPPLTVGLSILLFLTEWRWMKTDDETWYRLCRFFERLFVVNFGAGVATGAPILLLDEPTEGLDAASEAVVLEALKRLKADAGDLAPPAGAERCRSASAVGGRRAGLGGAARLRISAAGAAEVARP